MTLSPYDRWKLSTPEEAAGLKECLSCGEFYPKRAEHECEVLDET